MIIESSIVDGKDKIEKPRMTLIVVNKGRTK
jgi:hypothetical protein